MMGKKNSPGLAALSLLGIGVQSGDWAMPQPPVVSGNDLPGAPSGSGTFSSGRGPSSSKESNHDSRLSRGGNRREGRIKWGAR